MRRYLTAVSLVGAVALPGATSASGQEAERPQPLAVGAMAPDFTIPGATRFGVLRDPVRLSDFRGKTVVLAFFFRARTRG